MALFKKKCTYCKEKINKGEEIFEEMKIPEFVEPKLKAFCSKEHAELYKCNIKGTPTGNSCPFCKT